LAGGGGHPGVRYPPRREAPQLPGQARALQAKVLDIAHVEPAQ